MNDEYILLKFGWGRVEMEKETQAKESIVLHKIIIFKSWIMLTLCSFGLVIETLGSDSLWLR
jgi:hypothetical protein